jgi:hypothetical protein
MSFHLFPKDAEFRKKWIQAVRRQNWTPSQYDVLCSDHFASNCFKTTNSRRKLLPTSVPTIFTAFPAHLRPPSPKRRRLLVRQVPEDAATYEEVESEQTPMDENSSLPCASGRGEFPCTDTRWDHSYSFPLGTGMDSLKQECLRLRDILGDVTHSQSNLRRNWEKSRQKHRQLKDVLDEIKVNKMVSSEGVVVLEQFEGVALETVRELVSNRKKTAAFPAAVKDFALTLHFYSPRAYDFCRKIFSLPSPSTLRRFTCGIQCLPGFQQASFHELLQHQGDENYANAALLVDGIHVKETIEFDKHLGQGFGYIDFGGQCELGETEEKANESVVCMLVGYKAYWKLPISYFLCRGMKAGILAGIIRESILQAFEVGVCVRSVTMDGARANVSAFAELGANILTKNIEDQTVSFPHPHPSCKSEVVAIIDPPHCFKNIRGALAHFKQLVWPGKGRVRWDLFVMLQNLQETHGLRLGNKLTARHINFHQNKMKVPLAIQTVASDSVGRALRWLHSEKVPGFDNKDTLATADFVQLHDKVFDILNSRSLAAFGCKKAIKIENFWRAEEVFKEFEALYSSLEDVSGKKIINSLRKTGPMGALGAIKAVKHLVSDMQKGVFPISYLATYKFSQDHLEIWFNAIRLRNGWSYNPTCRQFRFAFRALLVHAGKHVIGSPNANCVAQDETAVLSVSCSDSSISYVGQDSQDSEVPMSQDENNNLATEESHVSNCGVGRNCEICKAAICYIAGFFTFSVCKQLKCVPCKLALSHSEDDPCLKESLLHFKNYVVTDYSNTKGLAFPSGSLCNLFLHVEKVFRSNQSLVSSKHAIEKFLHKCLTGLDFIVFPALTSHHATDTAIGVDNHYWSLIQLLVKKYLNMRLKKVMKESAYAKKSGNSVHRSRIFQSL